MLNFLSRLPNKYLLIFIFLIIFAAYIYFRNEFLAQLVDKALIAILTLLGLQRASQDFIPNRANTGRANAAPEKVIKTPED